jgi:hypothetical protein
MPGLLMPKLIVFAPCQKIIVDREDSLVSAISLINGMIVEVPADSPLPDNVETFSPWAVLATWLKEPGDEGKRFEQRLQILSPSGIERGGGTLEFEMTARTHNNTMKGQTLPVSEPGELTLRLSLREANSSTDWAIKAEFPLEIIHQKPLVDTAKAT